MKEMLKSSSAALSLIGSSSGKIFLNDEDISFNSGVGSGGDDIFDTHLNINNQRKNSSSLNEEAEIDLNNESIEYYNCNNNYYSRAMSHEYAAVGTAAVVVTGMASNANNLEKPKANSGFNNLKEFHHETSHVFNII